jgi:hypothetical protein
METRNHIKKTVLKKSKNKSKIRQMRKLTSYFTYILLISISLNSCTSSNPTIDEEIKSLSNANAKTYSIKQLRENVFLENDSVYYQGDKTPYSGIIQVIGNYEYTKPDGEIAEKQGILAVFNIKNGAFSGEQLYSNVQNSSKMPVFLKTKIIPGLYMMPGEDFIEVNEGEPSNYSTSYRRPFETEPIKKYYRIINQKQFSPIDISVFWPNGILFYKSTYTFDYWLYLWSAIDPSDYRSKLKVADNEAKKNISVYHYNGNLAYKGPIENHKMTSHGSFYDFIGKKTDSTNFAIPTGKKFIASNIEYFSIDDKLYKCYRYFF